MKKAVLSKKEILDAKVGAIMRHTQDTFKSKRVKLSTPKIIFVDKGGKYLDKKEKGDRKNTYVTISWAVNSEIRELVYSFQEYETAMVFALEFKDKYINTRLGEAFI